MMPRETFKDFFKRLRQDFNGLRYWSELSGRYRFLKPPTIPSPDDQLHYKEYADQVGNGGRVAVLGATPGIRALLRGSDAKVCVVDYSRAMYRAMNRLLPHEVVRGETSY